MENNYFYKKFQKKADSELERVLNNQSSYTENAILAATHILKERKVELTEEQQLVVKNINLNIEKKKNLKEIRKKETELSLLQKRIIAFLIDLVVLSGISFLFGFLYIDTAIIREPWEPFFSLLLILGYFVLLNSNIGKGTLGKRLMNITVKNHQFQMVNIIESLKRYSILIIPYFLFNTFDNLSYNLFGVLTGLKFSYYIAIFYFLLTDKEQRRSFHDLLTKSSVMPSDKKTINVDFPKKKIKTFYFIISGVVLFFIVTNFSLNNNGNELVDFEIQTEQLETTLNDNLSTFEYIANDIREIEGVSDLEGISLNTVNGIVNLEITIIPNSFYSNAELTDKVYESLNGKELTISRLDNVKIIKHYGFDMTLASFNKTETKNYKQ
jgi:uncharacterized RDD family membrane protein YckC